MPRNYDRVKPITPLRYNFVLPPSHPPLHAAYANVPGELSRGSNPRCWASSKSLQSDVGAGRKFSRSFFSLFFSLSSSRSKGVGIKSQLKFILLCRSNDARHTAYVMYLKNIFYHFELTSKLLLIIIS